MACPQRAPRGHVISDSACFYFSTLYPTYDWVNDDGRKNVGDWGRGRKEGGGKFSSVIGE